MSLEDEAALATLARDLQLRFDGGEVFLDGQPVGESIRGEDAGRAASRIAALPALRLALLERQRAFRVAPGLVSDGRDMGSVVFPDAALKVFLTASAEERAQRRYKQLIAKEVDASMTALLQDIRDRDYRDSNRATAPLLKCSDAIEFDTTGIPVELVVAKVLQLYQEHQKKH